MVTGWATDPAYLDRLYRSINVIDWNVDFVRFFHQEYSPSSIMNVFLSEKNNRTMESLPMNLYAINLPNAIGFELT